MKQKLLSPVFLRFESELTISPDISLNSKANRLEFYTQGADGLALQHSKAIHGRVAMLAKLVRPGSSETDHLFVGTDRHTYFTVSWDTRANQLRTERSYVDLADSSSRSSEADRCLIDPSERFMTLELYEGLVTVIPIVQASLKQRKKTGPAVGLQVGELGEPSQARIEELFVRSSAFMYCEAKSPPRMALLYEDTQGRVKLKVRELMFTPAGASGDGAGVADLNEVDVLREELEMGASHLIPVPAPLGMGDVSLLPLHSLCFPLADLNEVFHRSLCLFSNYRWTFDPWRDLD